MNTLLIDNYDSFTFNLYQILGEVNGKPPIVIPNDAVHWEDIQHLPFDNIVLSPGPGRPDHIRDFGVCKDIILKTNKPLLGVCLGHQGICHYFGGEIDYASEIMHGRLSEIYHDSVDLFSSLPSPMKVVRYHSLLVTKIPTHFKCLAQTADGIVMAVRHTQRPIWGVQFHPESICTEYGVDLLKNFRDLTLQARTEISDKSDKTFSYAEKQQAMLSLRKKDIPSRVHAALRFDFDRSQGKDILSFLTLENPVYRHRKIEGNFIPQSLFEDCFSKNTPNFWLDSAKSVDFSRFSYMGDATGPFAERLTYSVGKTLNLCSRGKSFNMALSVFDFLEKRLAQKNHNNLDLPFNFQLGYVGFWGYELKSECGYNQAFESDLPDSEILFSDRLVVFDHQELAVHLLCLEERGMETRAEAWLDRISERLHAVCQSTTLHESNGISKSTKDKPHHDLRKEYRHEPEDYLSMIEAVKDRISKGDSYEVCLTNAIHVELPQIDSWYIYQNLRSINPAPYAAFLNFDDYAIACSSPERFLTIQADGYVESKPIKGTKPRGNTHQEDERLKEELRSNEKDRAENLMIVDLLRNDLGKVCDIGSIDVPKMFAVESYETVHQLVSTVRGKLKPHVSAIQCFKSAFPGGSMTGAPKKRTLEIIDALEKGPRGPYSGAIGFLSLNGAADFNIVIRTIVIKENQARIGVGGAIVSLSSPEDELEETHLKAQAVLKALSEAVSKIMS